MKDRAVPVGDFRSEVDRVAVALRYDAVMTDFKPLHLAKDSETLEVLVVFKNGLDEVQVGPPSLVPVPFHDCFVLYDGKFTHYKGGKYALLHHARRVGTGEEVVVYRSLETSFVWVRPKAMFFGTLENGTRRFAPE